LVLILNICPLSERQLREKYQTFRSKKISYDKFPSVGFLQGLQFEIFIYTELINYMRNGPTEPN